MRNLQSVFFTRGHYILLITMLCIQINGLAQKRNPENKAVFLEDISWTTAQRLLTANTVVVIPLGAESKEHGPHLPLCTDYLQATDCTDRIALQRNVVIAPVLNSGFYPAFIKYPGSVSLSYTVSVEVVLQTIRCLADYGPKRFYIINIGISTTPTLQTAAAILAGEGILLYYSNYDRARFSDPLDTISTHNFDGHAGEIETSSILDIRPDLVEMAKAVNDTSMKGKTGMMSPVLLPGGALNTSGIIGYAKFATKEKGAKISKVFADSVLWEIDSTASCALPKSEDRNKMYTAYEGNYTDSNHTKLQIIIKDSTLNYVLNDRDITSFFHLHLDAADYFTSTFINILFVRNDKGDVIKAWCQNRGKSYWLTRVL